MDQTGYDLADFSFDSDATETQDATLRHYEGGGNIPHEWRAPQTPQYGFNGLGQSVGDKPWYKSPTFLTIAALGIAAIAVVWYNARKPGADSVARLDDDEVVGP